MKLSLSLLFLLDSIGNDEFLHWYRFFVIKCSSASFTMRNIKMQRFRRRLWYFPGRSVELILSEVSATPRHRSGLKRLCYKNGERVKEKRGASCVNKKSIHVSNNDEYRSHPVPLLPSSFAPSHRWLLGNCDVKHRLTLQLKASFVLVKRTYQGTDLFTQELMCAWFTGARVLIRTKQLAQCVGNVMKSMSTSRGNLKSIYVYIRVCVRVL